MWDRSGSGSGLCDTLLVTSAVRPAPGQLKLAVVDPADRLRQTLCSLVSWAEEPGIRRIVVCDGSNSGAELTPLYDYCRSRGQQLEVLSFGLPVHEVAARGKGYGEGLIIAHALTHSVLLRSSPSFYKVTGRLYIRNFAALQRPVADCLPTFPCEVPRWRVLSLGRAYPFLGSTANIRRLANRHWSGLLPGTATWFWHCPRRYYEDYLYDCFETVCDPERLFLEHAMFVPLAIHGFRRFSPVPLVVGQSGTSGRLYAGVDYPAAVRAVADRLLGVVCSG